MAHESLFKIHIPEPCHEDWGKMTATEQGAFCKVCSKEVIDFSTLSDTEISSYLSLNEGKKICGRFLKTQLDEPLTKKVELPGYVFPLLYSPIRTFAMALIAASALTIAGCGSSEPDQSGGKIGKLKYEHVQGGVDIKPDTTVKADTTQKELINGEIEYKVDTTYNSHMKMGMVKKKPDSEYLKGEVRSNK